MNVKIICLSIFFLAVPVCLSASDIQPAPMQSFVLKHRLAVIPISAYSKKEPGISALIKILDPKLIFPEEGVIISTEDWANVMDLTKSEIDKSDFMRLVELPVISEKIGENSKVFSSLGDELDLILLVKYGASTKNRRVFFRLLEADSGHLLTTSDATAFELASAVKKAIADIENHLLTMSWRCRVIAVDGNQMIINRGHLDGLRKGIELVGYSIKKHSSDGGQKPEDLLIMQYGKNKGLYRIVETRAGFSKVEPSSGRLMLSKGDILELPEVRLRERDVKSRGMRLWDKIYDE